MCPVIPLLFFHQKISSKKELYKWYQSIGIFYVEGIFYLRSSFIIYQLVLIVLYNIFYFDNKCIIRKGYKCGFSKLAITHSDLNANINISHFKPNILEAIDHLKGISHKYPDVDSKFDFIARTTASNITKETSAYIITDLI